jgi:hypothetical protein
MSSTDLPRLAATFAGVVEFFKCVKRCANHVVGVGRTMALGHDVGHAHHFKNCAHRATSDDAGTLGSGRIITDSGAMVARHVV